MRKLAIVLGIVLLLGGSAQACCRGRRGTILAHRPVYYYHPGPARGVPPVAYAPQPAAYAPQPAAYAPRPVAQPSPPAAPAGVQPSYRYEAVATGQPAYYYTYDESGKLIVQQWVDWVFRGGRAAGMPRPPMPVIGWFVR